MTGSNSSEGEKDKADNLQNVEAAKELAFIQKKSALVDNLANIPPFNGDTSAISISDFLDKFNNFADLFRWDEEERKFALLNRLNGNASRLVKLHKGKPLKDIIDILKNRYSRHETPDVALNKFLQFKQMPGTPVQEFYDRAYDLSLKALVVDGIAEDVADTSRNAMLHSMLLANLAPEIRKGVITRDPKTPQDILRYALLEEKAINSINPFYAMQSHQAPPTNIACAAAPPPSPKNNDNIEIQELKEQIALLTAKIDSMAEAKQIRNNPDQTNTQNNRNFYCYICKKATHTTDFCFYNTYNSNDNRGRTSNNNFNRGNNGNNSNYRRGNNYRGRNWGNSNRDRDVSRSNNTENSENIHNLN